jgi:hypothetical protein
LKDISGRRSASPGGDREFVLPGNREYVAGDRIARPQGGGGGGGNGSGGDGDSEDSFVFSLSREEFMQIFFDDLELPNLARTEYGRTEQRTSTRAGFTKSGVPANLAIVRTVRQSLARRIALGASIARELVALEAEFAIARGDRPRGRSGADLRGAAAADAAEGQAAVHRRTGSALSQSRLAPRADRARRDVLPDGRVGVDGRGQEGSRQALFHVAVSVPDAQVRRRRPRVRPAYG